MMKTFMLMIFQYDMFYVLLKFKHTSFEIKIHRKGFSFLNGIWICLCEIIFQLKVRGRWP